MQKKIGFLGVGAWGFCLARLLSRNGHQVTSWARDPALAHELQKTGKHPHVTGLPTEKTIQVTSDIREALQDADVIVEAVTSKGIRPVFEEINSYGLNRDIPIVLTSKGIEQNSGMILSDVVISILGDSVKTKVSSLSGPSFAQEVSHNLPTAVVCAGYTQDTVNAIVDLFTTPFFRVYPTSDVRGVAFGGALKNIIAIACGLSDGMKLGCGAKAALMTRGLHEIVKLARNQGCRPETLYGLSGMGDLFLTCSSEHSRNYKFGKLLSHGYTPEEAKMEIDMVVEGAYTAVSALQLSKQLDIPMPITEVMNAILEGKIQPFDAIQLLMKRSIKEESL